MVIVEDFEKRCSVKDACQKLGSSEEGRHESRTSVTPPLKWLSLVPSQKTQCIYSW